MTQGDGVDGGGGVGVGGGGCGGGGGGGGARLGCLLTSGVLLMSILLHFARM